jgi:hypothetical protein
MAPAAVTSARTAGEARRTSWFIDPARCVRGNGGQLVGGARATLRNVSPAVGFHLMAAKISTANHRI